MTGKKPELQMEIDVQIDVMKIKSAISTIFSCNAVPAPRFDFGIGKSFIESKLSGGCIRIYVTQCNAIAKTIVQ